MIYFHGTLIENASEKGEKLLPNYIDGLYSILLKSFYI